MISRSGAGGGTRHGVARARRGQSAAGRLRLSQGHRGRCRAPGGRWQGDRVPVLAEQAGAVRERPAPRCSRAARRATRRAASRSCRSSTASSNAPVVPASHEQTTVQSALHGRPRRPRRAHDHEQGWVAVRRRQDGNDKAVPHCALRARPAVRRSGGRPGPVVPPFRHGHRFLPSRRHPRRRRFRPGRQGGRSGDHASAGLRTHHRANAGDAQGSGGRPDRSLPAVDGGPHRLTARQHESQGGSGMVQVTVRLADAMETSLITLYGKAIDARMNPTVLGDTMAARAVEKIDYDFERLKMSAKIAPNAAARAKHFDEWTSEFLAKHERATVVHLGAGLDSRVWRVDPGPGVTWYDVDYPEVIDVRSKIFPERDNYRMIASS